MSTRESILEVTARLYAEHGWRGTTTRRIADAAGVNEVTIFRQFGSKETLLFEAIRCASGEEDFVALPAIPRDLRTELIAWGVGHHQVLSGRRGLMRTCLGELDERPELTPTICHGGTLAFADGVRYLQAARERGLIAPDGSVEAAVVMLTHSIFLDAMTRDVIPQQHPMPANEAIEMFIDLILRALGQRAAA